MSDANVDLAKKYLVEHMMKLPAELDDFYSRALPVFADLPRSDEHKLEYTSLYEEYVALFDKQMSQFLVESGATEAELQAGFEKIKEQGGCKLVMPGKGGGKGGETDVGWAMIDRGLGRLGYVEFTATVRQRLEAKAAAGEAAGPKDAGPKDVGPRADAATAPPERAP